MNKTQDCFQCRSSENLEKLFVAKDIYRKMSKETFNYYNCSKCDHIFLRDIPNNLGEYYGDEYYDLPSIESFKKTALNEKFKFNIVRDHFNEGDKICEIGPSVGVFLYNAKSYGLECTGIEMSKECCKFMSETLKVNAINTNTPEIEIRKIEKHFLQYSLQD